MLNQHIVICNSIELFHFALNIFFLLHLWWLIDGTSRNEKSHKRIGRKTNKIKMFISKLLLFLLVWGKTIIIIERMEISQIRNLYIWKDCTGSYQVVRWAWRFCHEKSTSGSDHTFIWKMFSFHARNSFLVYYKYKNAAD